MRDRGAKRGGKRRGYGVDALYLVYVGGVERGGEGQEGQEGRVRRRYGVGVETKVDISAC